MSDCVWPQGLQHVRLPCHSPSPEICSNSYPLSQWCHPTILSSVVPFSSCLQSFSASGTILMSWLFASGGQSTGVSASASVLLMNIQSWFLLGWTGLISLQSKGLSRVFINTTVQKHQFLGTQPSLWSQLSYPYMINGKTIPLTRWTFVGKVMSLLFNTLSRFVFLPSNEQASFNFVAAVTICSDFGAWKNKVCHCFHCFPNYLSLRDGTGCHDFSFLNVEF